jgi:hypothetical protein
VNIPGQFQEIVVLIYQDRLVSTLKDMSRFVALESVIGGIGRIHIVHYLGKIRLGSL